MPTCSSASSYLTPSCHWRLQGVMTTHANLLTQREQLEEQRRQYEAQQAEKAVRVAVS